MATIDGLIANTYERIPIPIRAVATPATVPAGIAAKLALGLLLPHELRHTAIRMATRRSREDPKLVHGVHVTSKCEGYAELVALAEYFG